MATPIQDGEVPVASSNRRSSTTKRLVGGKSTSGKGTRETEPTRSWSPYLGGGIGLVPRRNSRYVNSLLSGDGVEVLAKSSPMKLLLELPASHPTIGLAQWNALRTMFPSKGWGFRCYKPDVANQTLASGDDASVGDVDKAGNASIANLIKSLPKEIGGISGLAGTLAISLLYTGMACVEGVPFDDSREFAGLNRIWPVDSTTIAFGRPDRNSDLVPYQHQQWSGIDKAKKDSTVVTWNNWVPLSTDRFFWAAIDQQPDDPYGLAPYSTALNEALADIALMRDLRDAVHNAAWPRLDVGVNLAELHRVAVEVHRMTDPKKASDWVAARFNEVVDYVESLGPDDNLVHDTTGKVDTKQPGSFTGLEGVLQFLRQRLVQALKSLPTLMGINDGSTYNYTSIEWAIYAAGLESLRDIVFELIADVLTLHLQLQGSTSIVRPWCEKIRTNDALVDANTEEVRIRNEASKVVLGWTTNDDASEAVSKKPAVKQQSDEVIMSVIGKGMQANGDGSRQSGNAGQGGANKGNKAGTSQEEKKNQ